MDNSSPQKKKHTVAIILIAWAIMIIACGFGLHYASEHQTPDWFKFSLPFLMMSGVIPLYIIASKTNYKLDKGNLPGYTLDQQYPVLGAILRRRNPDALQKLTWFDYIKVRLVWWAIGLVVSAFAYLFFLRG